MIRIWVLVAMLIASNSATAGVTIQSDATYPTRAFFVRVEAGGGQVDGETSDYRPLGPYLDQGAASLETPGGGSGSATAIIDSDLTEAGAILLGDLSVGATSGTSNAAVFTSFASVNILFDFTVDEQTPVQIDALFQAEGGSLHLTRNGSPDVTLILFNNVGTPFVDPIEDRILGAGLYRFQATFRVSVAAPKGESLSETGSGSASIIFDASADCGNGVLDSGEGCDDGNTTAGDGCGPACSLEHGVSCEGEPSVCSEIPVPSASPLGVAMLCTLMGLAGYRSLRA